MLETKRKVENGTWCCTRIKWHDGHNSYYTYDDKAREIGFNSEDGRYQCTAEYEDLPDGGYKQIEHHNKFGEAITIYDKCGRITSIDTNSEMVKYVYDGTDNVEMVVVPKDPDGEVSSVRFVYTYDEDGRITSIKQYDAYPSLQEYTYDKNGNLIKYTISNYETKEYLYTNDITYTGNKKIEVINDLYKVITEFDSNGYGVHIINEIPDDVLFYDAYGDKEECRYEGIAEIFFEYDKDGNNTKQRTIYRGDGEECVNEFFYTFIHNK